MSRKHTKDRNAEEGVEQVSRESTDLKGAVHFTASLGKALTCGKPHCGAAPTTGAGETPSASNCPHVVLGTRGHTVYFRQRCLQLLTMGPNNQVMLCKEKKSQVPPTAAQRLTVGATCPDNQGGDLNAKSPKSPGLAPTLYKDRTKPQPETGPWDPPQGSRCAPPHIFTVAGFFH